MIFSSKKDKSVETPVWGVLPIERVSSYTYLGVPFTENQNLQMAKELYFRKAKVAALNLQSLIYRTKMNSFNSQLTLYNALVRSTLSYCSPIWGLKYSEEFENFRIGFMKQLFLLPKMTPGWFVRLELCIGNSEIFYIKSVLHFWIKIIRKNKESLIYKCYEAIKASKCRLNWFHQLKTLLRKWQIESILELENMHNLTYKEIVKQVALTLEKIESDNISKDICRMRETHVFSIYSSTKTHVIREEYLEEDCAWKVKQLIMQLKLGISHLTYKGRVVRTNVLECFYGKVPNNKCNLCGVDRILQLR
jgi:hypothetical protein